MLSWDFSRSFHFPEFICGFKSRVFPQDNGWSVLQYSFHLQRSQTLFLYFRWSQPTVVFTRLYLQRKLGKLWYVFKSSFVHLSIFPCWKNCCTYLKLQFSVFSICFLLLKNLWVKVFQSIIHSLVIKTIIK